MSYNKTEQSIAEGAEDFLKKYTIYCKNVISIEGKTWVLSTVIPQAMQEFATLHSQRMAEKMVEKNWININDRMPESGFCVLLYSESGGVAEGAWSDSNGYFEQWRWSAILSDVTHWMPLPNPPIR